MLVDTISQDVRTELQWELLYADDLAIIDITSTDTQNRRVMAEGINIQWSEDQCRKNRSVIDKDGTIDRDVDLRVQNAWSSWRKLTRVLYDRVIPLRLKAKVY